VESDFDMWQIGFDRIRSLWREDKKQEVVD
jgi:hypothetical protein